MQDRFDGMLRSTAPKSLTSITEGLKGLEKLPKAAWTAETLSPNEWTVALHNHLENLAIWVDVKDAQTFFANTAALDDLVTSLTETSVAVGMMSQNLADQLSRQAQMELPIFRSRCMGCNAPYDNGNHEHPNTPAKAELKDVDKDGQGMIAVHRVVSYLTFVSALLRLEIAGCVDGQNYLADRLVQENPPDKSPWAYLQERLVQAMGDYRKQHPLPALVGLIDNCSRMFPKVAHLTVSLLGLIVARRPSVALSMLDPVPLTDSFLIYLLDVAGRVSNAECAVEEYFGITQIINAIPLLYFLGDWGESFKILSKHELLPTLASLSINILHSATENGGEEWDGPADLEKFPELRGATVDVADLFRGIAVLRQRPLSFAAVALVEVLGRWSYCGVSVASAKIPCTPPPDVASTLTPREKDLYTEAVASSMEEYLDNWKHLVKRTPEFNFVLPLVEAIVRGEYAKQPTVGILRECLLHSSMKCSLSTCSRTESLKGGSLKLCSGGCRGLARYCCTEHQTEHWKQHKHFCQRKSNQSSKASKSKCKERSSAAGAGASESTATAAGKKSSGSRPDLEKSVEKVTDAPENTTSASPSAPPFAGSCGMRPSSTSQRRAENLPDKTEGTRTGTAEAGKHNPTGREVEETIHLRSHPAVVVIIPNLPADVDPELRAALRMMFGTPHFGKKAEIIGAHSTYLSALDAAEHGGKVIEPCFGPRFIETCMDLWQQNGKSQDIVTLDWPSMVHRTDPDLFQKHCSKMGLLTDGACCWHCAKVTQTMLRCSACRKAVYCSKACQRASWWHHRGADADDFLQCRR